MSKRWQIKWRKSCFRSTFSFSSFSLSPPSTLLLIIFLFSFIPLRSSKPLLVSEGYWAEPWALTEMPLCAVIDPSKDFRWHALGCGGPETAGFLCEMEGEPFWLVLNVNVNEKLIDDFSLSFPLKTSKHDSFSSWLGNPVHGTAGRHRSIHLGQWKCWIDTLMQELREESSVSEQHG